MRFNFANGSVEDDSGFGRALRVQMAGVFTLPPQKCVQKVSALYSLAMQAGIAWTGDHPHQPSASPVGSEPRVLDIENCGDVPLVV